MIRKTITAKFLTALFLVLLVGQSVGSFILVMYTRTALLESLEKRIKRTAEFTSGVSGVPIQSMDYGSLDGLLEGVMKDEDISSVHVTDASGKTVRENIKSEDRELSSVNPLFYTKTMSISVPVLISGTTVGAVKIDFDGGSVNRNISDSMFTLALYQVILLIGVGMIVMVLFNRNIKKPVGEINRAVERITMGDLHAELPELGDNEIGVIAKGIRFLSERLLQTVSKVNSTASNVSTAIRQVDVTYTNVGDSVTRQSTAVQDIIKSIHNANRAQAEISQDIERLSSFSIENVSSLIELKATAEEIASNTHRLLKSTEDSYSVVAQMTQTAKTISRTSGEALSAIEDTSASVEEIGASVREVEDHARASSKMAEKVKEVTSEMGMMAIVDAVEGMENISGEVNKTAEIIKRLGARSSDIEKVLSVIKDVTEQTNLLSLNAAILAVQAGEYGKSFSVVADEIRGLSERTATSTREIGGIVKNIQRDIKDTVNSIDSAREKVEEGHTLVLNVGDALKQILTASEHSTEMAVAIERATEEQANGLRQINSAVEEIRQMMHSIAKSTSEQEKALSHLLEGVGEVKEVADLTKRGTEEQALGTKGISKNLEMANERVTRINEAVVNQKKINDSIIQAMEQINNLGLGSMQHMGDVTSSLKTLFDEIEILKKEMEVFKTA